MPGQPACCKTQRSTTVLQVLVVVIVILTLMITSTGLWYDHPGKSYDFVNLYGRTIRIWGKGLYAHDSFFKAPIFQGTDLIMLAVACPLLTLALIMNIKTRNLFSRMFLISLLPCFLYYASSMAFGATYNLMMLPYIALFSASFFAIVTGISGVDLDHLGERFQGTLPYRGIYAFLVFTGLALFGAWLPDILISMSSGRPLELIEHYTTEITYVLDLGLIAPGCFVCWYLLTRRQGIGYVLLDMLLTLCIIIGVMLPMQTAFQMKAGIELPLAVVVTKIVSFCLLALFALFFKIRLMKAILFSEVRREISLQNSAYA